MTYAATSGNICMMFSGDTLISRALSPFREKAFLDLRSLLLGGDVRFTNGEILFHDYEDQPGYPSGMSVRCDPRFIKDLQWLGIHLISCANNHAYDFGADGVRTNIRNLDSANLVHSGTGRNYAEALAPAYLDTPGGRVALISATTTGPTYSREQRPDMEGRAGTNLVRWTNRWTVDAETFGTLQRIAERFDWPKRVWPWWQQAYGGGEQFQSVVRLADRNTLEVQGIFSDDPYATFVLGTAFAHHTDIHRLDLERNIASVRRARAMADWVIFSLHNHEGGATPDDPAEHVVTLAHAAVDAVADVVVGHGPRRDRGIEIYQNKPILHSLSSLVDEWQTMALMPQEVMLRFGLGNDDTMAELVEAFDSGRGRAADSASRRSAIVNVVFAHNQLKSVRIHPIDLGAANLRSQAGRPMLAEAVAAEQVLQRFQHLSAAFQTDVDRCGTTGAVRLVER
jgi:poly-gamma-glutamate synthesis protein (capsule biosynthesis protein)